MRAVQAASKGSVLDTLLTGFSQVEILGLRRVRDVRGATRCKCQEGTRAVGV